MANNEESGQFSHLSFLHLPHAIDTSLSTAISSDCGSGAGSGSEDAMSGASLPSSSSSDPSMPSSNSMGMHMTFYWGKQVSILFDAWRTDKPFEYGFALLSIFVACILHQFLTVYRAKLETSSSKESKAAAPRNARFLQDELENSRNHPSPTLLDSSSSSNSSKVHLLSSFLYLVNLTSSYLLMLIVMTYNAGLFIAVILGSSCGYLIFRRPALRANNAYTAETCCE